MSKDVPVWGAFVSREDTACYRLYAANCVEIAENVTDTERRLFLLRMAQAWGNLADQVEKADGRTHPEDENPRREIPESKKPVHHPDQA
jgi:hypothetical protein